MTQNILNLPHNRMYHVLRKNDMRHLRVDLPHVQLVLPQKIDAMRQYKDNMPHINPLLPHSHSVLRHCIVVSPHTTESAGRRQGHLPQNQVAMRHLNVYMPQKRVGFLREAPDRGEGEAPMTHNCPALRALYRCRSRGSVVVTHNLSARP